MTEECEFFILVPPGFEEEAEREIQFYLELWGKKAELSREKGGISLSIDKAVGLELNRFLKLPSRILLRLARFRCRDFTKLYKKVEKLDWNKMIAGGHLEWRVSQRNSRLKIEKRLKETCEKAFVSYRRGNTPPKGAEEKNFAAYLRMVDDVCEISLDTSGDHLHRRGYRKNISEAPIRENLAAGLLWFSIEKMEKGHRDLIDPMTGSGTFLFEADHLLREVKSRKFAFEFFKGYERQSLAEGEESFFHSYHGFDRDKKTLRGAMENEKLYGRGSFNWQCEDVFEGSYLKKNSLVLLNPPYDHRIKTSSKTFYADLLKAIQKKFEPAYIGMISPEGAFQAPRSLKMAEKRFSNGGLAVCFDLFKVD